MKVSGYSTLVVCLTGLRIIIGGKGCGHFIWLDKWINQYPERVNDNGDHLEDEATSERNIPHHKESTMEMAIRNNLFTIATLLVIIFLVMYVLK